MERRQVAKFASRSLGGHNNNSGRRDHRVNVKNTSSSYTENSRTRISSKTGGFEGSAPTPYDAYFYEDEDETVRADNTIRSSPEGPNCSGYRYSMKTAKKPMLRRGLPGAGRVTSNATEQQQHARAGFFRRWTSSSHSNTKDSNNVKNIPDFLVRAKKTVSLSTKSLATHEKSNASFHQCCSHSGSTPIRKNGSITKNNISTTPRFILPDELPPGSAIKQSRRHELKPKGSSLDDTSAAVVHCPCSCDSSSDEQQQQGVEVTISSAPSAAAVPRSCRSLPHQQIPATTSYRIHVHDSDESTVGSWSSKLPITDDDLMDDTTISGVLRLTEDGLKTHERRTLEKSIPGVATNQLRTESSPDAAKTPVGKSLGYGKDRRPTNSKKNNKVGGVRSMSTLLKMKGIVEDDVADFSLAPLNEMEDLIETPASKSPITRAPSDSEGRHGCVNASGLSNKWNFSLRRKEKCVPLTAAALLERERLAAMESQTKKVIMEQHEKLRLEKKRQAYLEVQRARERDQPQTLSAEQRKSIFVSMELVEAKDKAGNGHVSRSKKNGASQTHSTLSSSSTVALPACVVCKQGMRTHIATPCMHFAYCKECASRLARQGKGCYVCSRPDVSFASVSV